MNAKMLTVMRRAAKDKPHYKQMKKWVRRNPNSVSTMLTVEFANQWNHFAGLKEAFTLRDYVEDRAGKFFNETIFKLIEEGINNADNDTANEEA